ncbi:hypothetical protein FQR65_LT17012 [Abscondita terminalis]|nr:hypothetical protein FQR65_LT17012 [Abscondita terminalis]
MKKLLLVLSTLSFATTPILSVISCTPYDAEIDTGDIDHEIINNYKKLKELSDLPIDLNIDKNYLYEILDRSLLMTEELYESSMFSNYINTLHVVVQKYEEVINESENNYETSTVYSEKINELSNEYNVRFGNPDLQNLLNKYQEIKNLEYYDYINSYNSQISRINFDLSTKINELNQVEDELSKTHAQHNEQKKLYGALLKMKSISSEIFNELSNFSKTGVLACKAFEKVGIILKDIQALANAANNNYGPYSEYDESVSEIIKLFQNDYVNNVEFEDIFKEIDSFNSSLSVIGAVGAVSAIIIGGSTAIYSSELSDEYYNFKKEAGSELSKISKETQQNVISAKAKMNETLKELDEKLNSLNSSNVELENKIKELETQQKYIIKQIDNLNFEKDKLNNNLEIKQSKLLFAGLLSKRGKMKTIIIGGTAVGMGSATRLKKANKENQIVVYQKSSYVSFGACGLPYFLAGEFSDENGMLARTVEQIKEEGIDLHINSTVTNVDFDKKIVTVLKDGKQFYDNYDHLIIGVGARPIVPDLPGIDSEGVFTLTTLEDGINLKKRISKKEFKKAAIIGAGFIGLETAEALVRVNKEVVLVEMANRVSPNAFDEEISKEIEVELLKNNVNLKLNSQLVEILSKNGKVNGIKLSGDCSTSENFITKEKIYSPLATIARKVPKIITENIMGSNSIFYGSIQTAIVRVFDKSIARTGLNENEIKAKGIDYSLAYIKDKDRTNYVKNQKELVLKIMMNNKTREIIGAQIIGAEDAVIRIDAIIPMI